MIQKAAFLLQPYKTFSHPNFEANGAAMKYCTKVHCYRVKGENSIKNILPCLIVRKGGSWRIWEGQRFSPKFLKWRGQNKMIFWSSGYLALKWRGMRWGLSLNGGERIHFRVLRVILKSLVYFIILFSHFYQFLTSF